MTDSIANNRQANSVAQLESAEVSVRQHQQGATDKLQQAVQSVRPEDALSVYRQLAQYDKNANQASLLEMKEGHLTMKSIFATAPEDAGTKSVLHEAQGTINHTEWNSGKHKGEKEDVFQDGAKVHYTPDGKGGEIVTQTDSAGDQSTEHATSDGKGGAVVVHTDSDKDRSYTAHYRADGFMTADWKNGRHLERYEDKKGLVRTTLTGDSAENDFTATESNGETRVQYADGAQYVQTKDGKEQYKAAHTALGMLDALNFRIGLPNRTDVSEWALIGSTWMGMSQEVDDVKNKQS